MKHTTLFAALSALWLCAAPLGAQEADVPAFHPYIGVYDTGTHKMFQFTNGGVNLRTYPGTDEGKLMQWTSDDGSDETETVIFPSDDPSFRQYRSNPQTGARLEAYHPVADQLMYYLAEGDGWVQLCAIPEWQCMMQNDLYTLRKFGRIIEVDTATVTKDDVLRTLAIPQGARKFSRIKGAYRRMPFYIFAEDHGTGFTGIPDLRIVFPIIASNTYVSSIARSFEVEEADGEPRLVQVQEQNDMTGDMETYTRLVMPQGDRPRMLAQLLVKMSDEEFGKFFDMEIEYLADPLDQEQPDIYFKGKDGAMYAFPKPGAPMIWPIMQLKAN